MTIYQIIQALRCTSAAGGPVNNCETCPYCFEETVPEDILGVAKGTTLMSCDCDKIAQDAAKALEVLAAQLGLPLTEEATKCER